MMTPQTPNRSTHVVIGDGWSALGATAYHLHAGKDVCWISGTGARLSPPLPTLASGEGAGAWAELARAFGIDPGNEQPGSFLREFRNKAFREPPWSRAADTQSRVEVQRETLWAAERFLVAPTESRFEAMTAGELEDRLRAAVLAHPRLHRIEGIPVESFVAEEGRLTAVVLSSGARISCEGAFFADSWEDLPRVIGASAGFPPAKALAFTRKREPMGALQATFQHSHRIGEEAPIPEGFYSSLHRETGEEFDRHVMGYFSSDGTRSHWTLCLAEAESEDNHEIGKRLRRMKNALEKMFSAAPWTSAEAPSFLATVQSEQVRFAEGVLFAGGEPLAAPEALSSIANLAFLTDGYGPSVALELARKAALGEGADPLPERAQAKAVDVDLEPRLD